MVKTLVQLLVILAAATAQANTVTLASLKEMALSEAQQLKGKPLPLATDAQVSGVLKLEDPKSQVITRPWNYFLGLKIQNYQAAGRGTNDLGENFDLSLRSPSVMPTLELGAILHPWKIANWSLSPLASARASYTNQKGSVKLKSGFTIDDAYLNTSMMAAGLGLNVQHDALAAAALEMNYRLGALNYTQASSNDFANFSKSANMQSLSATALWSLTKNTQLTLEYAQQSLTNNNSEIDINRNSYELGTRFLW